MLCFALCRVTATGEPGRLGQPVLRGGGRESEETQSQMLMLMDQEGTMDIMEEVTINPLFLASNSLGLLTGSKSTMGLLTASKPTTWPTTASRWLATVPPRPRSVHRAGPGPWRCRPPMVGSLAMGTLSRRGSVSRPYVRVLPAPRDLLVRMESQARMAPQGTRGLLEVGDLRELLGLPVFLESMVSMERTVSLEH